jgi:hypothetical protein
MEEVKVFRKKENRLSQDLMREEIMRNINNN